MAELSAERVTSGEQMLQSPPLDWTVKERGVSVFVIQMLNPKLKL